MELGNYKYVTVLGLISVVVLQLIWIHSSYTFTTKDIKNKCDGILEETMFQEAEKRFDSFLPQAYVSMPTTNSATPSIAYFEEVIYKKTKIDASLSSIDSLIGKILNSHNINSEYVIYRINGKTSKIIDVSKNVKTSIFSIKSKIIYTRINKSQGLQLVISNPYGELFKRLGLIIIISFIISIIIAMCIFQQIRIIIKQNNIARIRKDFSYAMIHDMKSPLASILLGLSNLKTGKLDSKSLVKAKYLSLMGDEANHLLVLINKVLTISKIEENKLTLNKTDVTLAHMVNDIVEKYSAKADKPINITMELKAETAFADEEYLKEAISNLVDNAVKYSKDSIDIKISSHETDCETLISVYDNGLGISETDQQIIFDKFERASALKRTPRGGAAGFGLGLNYVMQVMDAHNGRVGVESVKGEYSEFTLYIPKETKKQNDNDKITIG